MSEHPEPAVDRCLVATEELRWRCKADRFPFRDTSQIGDCPIDIIGQPRAMQALQLGVEVRSEGYNVFVAGEVGTGRSTAVRKVISTMETGETAPEDLVYVFNFQNSDRPQLLAFPAGDGRAFRDAMVDLVDTVRRNLPKLFESEGHRKRRDTLVEQAKDRHKGRLKEFEEKVTKEGFALVQVQMGEIVRPDIAPLIEEEPTPLDQLESQVGEDKFPAEEFERLKAAHAILTGEMESISKELRGVQRELRRELAVLDRRRAEPFVREAVEDIREAFPSVAVQEFHDQAKGYFLEHLDRFRLLADRDPTEGGPEALEEIAQAMTLPFTVNLLVDNGGTRGRPVLWESSPTFRNLFGIVERVQDASGQTETDHTDIKAGSLVRANGGFLVLDAMDVLVEPGVWPALKRTLRTHELEIQSFDPRNNAVYGASLQPEPVAIDVKVILIGTKQIYRTLNAVDEDFKKVFKIKADFAMYTDLSEEELGNYACFVQKKCRDDDLPPFTAAAVAAVVEHGVRLAGQHGRLTTQFNHVADLIRESGYWARQDGASTVNDMHVDLALMKQRRRLDLLEEMLRSRVADGTQLIDLSGSAVGQINGLVVLDVGDYSFGHASRITAVTAMGRTGILNIERESEMSGSVHVKGVLILAGFLRERFAQTKPLTLSASLAFEQSYGLVEGDSASCAELFALMSSLANVPIRQGIAITGSVNQYGEVQPIGGVNEKIEGYFDLCSLIGLDGEQGVVIPRRNLPQLMLRKDVVDAVRNGRFRIWAISSVEEGLEIMTGAPAGSPDGAGGYPPDSIMGRADVRLLQLAEGVAAFGAADLGR